jgi:hypothetical protein
MINSCKKEDSGSPDKSSCPSCSEHFAYIKTYVVDSVSFAILPGASVYCADAPFNYGNSVTSTTDLNGLGVVKTRWVTSNSGSTRPHDTTALYISAFNSTSCGFLKIDWSQLVENETLSVANISVRPNSYISVHLKDTSAANFYNNLVLTKMIAPSYKMYPSNVDTALVYGVYPLLNVSFGIYGQPLDSIVSGQSGDTTFVEVFN